MKINRPFPCILVSLALFFGLTAIPPDAGVSAAYAAAKAPVAQKKPEAQKPPAARAQPKARPTAAPGKSSPQKPAPAAPAKKQTAVAPVKKQATAAPAKQQPAAGEKLKNSLDAFAKDCVSRMNKQRRPGINAKEVKRQPDGSYLARYMAVDPDSLETSYNPTENNKTILYIGRMNYHEVEYVSMGKDQKQALAGPFNEHNRTPITELIKYKAGKWTY